MVGAVRPPSGLVRRIDSEYDAVSRTNRLTRKDDVLKWPRPSTAPCAIAPTSSSAVMVETPMDACISGPCGAEGAGLAGDAQGAERPQDPEPVEGPQGVAPEREARADLARLGGALEDLDSARAIAP